MPGFITRFQYMGAGYNRNEKLYERESKIEWTS